MVSKSLQWTAHTWTHLHRFQPVPIATKVGQCIVTMALVHLFNHPTSLILFCPTCLNSFSMSSPNAISKWEWISVLAIIIMSMDVQLWNPTSHIVYKVCEVREMLFKARYKVFLILAINVVSMIDPLDPWVKPQCHCQGIIGVAEPVIKLRWEGLMHRATSPFTLLKVDCTEYDNMPTNCANHTGNVHASKFDLILHVDNLEMCASWFLT